MDNKLAVIGSELPVLQAKGTYKYLVSTELGC